MSRSFFAIILFSFMALAQAVALVKNEAETGMSVNFVIPNQHTKWVANSSRRIKWDTPSVDYFDPMATANIFLAVQDSHDQSPCTNVLLAEGVLIRDGSALVTVPNVPHASNYIVVLTGMYGASSEAFTITGGSGMRVCPF